MKTRLIIAQLLLCTAFWAQDLKGSKWLLHSIDDLETGVSKQIGISALATLQFDSDSAYSGKFCNHFQGHYRHKDTAIKMGLANRTKMMCMGLDKYETEMLGLIPLATKYRIEDGSLYIFTTNHKRLHFKKDEKRE